MKTIDTEIFEDIAVLLEKIRLAFIKQPECKGAINWAYEQDGTQTLLAIKLCIDADYNTDTCLAVTDILGLDRKEK
jgi:hypothetical protein